MVSSYLKPGRLADVIAAIQVTASAERPERRIKDWAKELDRKEDSDTVAYWTSVFEEHREFFLTYRLKGDDELKAALRWRYTFKTYDSKSQKELTYEERIALSREERDLLTTKPLDAAQIQTLLNTAIGMRAAAMEEKKTGQWWISLVAAVLGFIGAILGALIAARLSLPKS